MVSWRGLSDSLPAGVAISLHKPGRRHPSPSHPRCTLAVRWSAEVRFPGNRYAVLESAAGGDEDSSPRALQDFQFDGDLLRGFDRVLENPAGTWRGRKARLSRGLRCASTGIRPRQRREPLSGIDEAISASRVRPASLLTWPSGRGASVSTVGLGTCSLVLLEVPQRPSRFLTMPWSLAGSR